MALKRAVKIMLRKILLWCVWCVDVEACCDCGVCGMWLKIKLVDGGLKT